MLSNWLSVAIEITASFHIVPWWTASMRVTWHCLNMITRKACSTNNISCTCLRALINEWVWNSFSYMNEYILSAFKGGYSSKTIPEVEHVECVCYNFLFLHVGHNLIAKYCLVFFFFSFGDDVFWIFLLSFSNFTSAKGWAHYPLDKF